MPAMRWFTYSKEETQKMAFKYPECEFCAFHNVEPGICEDCEDGSEYEPETDDEDEMSLGMRAKRWEEEQKKLKVAA